MINSCSLCGQCTVICPLDFPVAEVCRTTRMEMVDTGRMPPSAHEFALMDMGFSTGEFCRLSRHQPGWSTSRYLFYPGCQLAGSAPERVRQVYALLRQQLSGGVGLMLDCCGIPAHWAGQRELFEQTLGENTTVMADMGHPTLIVACSSCLSMFTEFAPELRVTSLWEALDSLALPKDIPPITAPPLALHDPCTARHRPELHTSVRSLCAKAGLEIREPECAGELADCCGYGGLMQFANQPLGRKAALVKAERSPHAGLAYCAMCRDNLAAVDRPVAHLLDYLFAAQDDPDPLARPNPGFSARQENRVRLKNELLESLWQETGASRPEYTRIALHLAPQVAALLNDRHILENDLRQVIHQAEATGKYLVNPANNHRLASHQPTRVTYWVEYEPSGEGYLVHNGYSHRMQLPEAKP